MKGGLGSNYLLQPLEYLQAYIFQSRGVCGPLAYIVSCLQRMQTFYNCLLRYAPLTHPIQMFLTIYNPLKPFVVVATIYNYSFYYVTNSKPTTFLLIFINNYRFATIGCLVIQRQQQKLHLHFSYRRNKSLPYKIYGGPCHVLIYCFI